MAKQSGLSQRIYMARTSTNGPAYDFSTGVGSIDTCDQSMAAIDVTSIDKSAFERIAGKEDSKLSWTSFWEVGAAAFETVTHSWKGMEAMAIWAFGAAEGVAGFAIQGLVTAYAINRSNAGALTIKPQIEADPGLAGDWGIVGANATDASAASHVVIDGGQQAPTLTISAITKANPAAVTTSTAHGLTSGDTVFVSGSDSSPVIDGDQVATVVDATHFTVAVDTSAGSVGTTGSVYRTSTRYGGRLWALVKAIASGNVNVHLFDSPDNLTFTQLTGMSTGNMNATTSAVQVSAASPALWRRYLQVQTSGTFTGAQLVALAHRGTGPDN